LFYLFFLKKKYDSTRDYDENKGKEQVRNRTSRDGTGMRWKPGRGDTAQRHKKDER
jgi:hypothetical protein